jgi:hypothetical protein
MTNPNSTGVNSDFYSTLEHSSYVYGGSIRNSDINISVIESMNNTSIVSGGSIAGSPPPVFTSTRPFYTQRIYDLTLNKYVYYRLTNITSSPTALQTTPNNSGNLNTSSHEILLTSDELV